MTRWTKIAVTALAALGAQGAIAGVASAASTHGCPRGDVCVYPRDAGWNHDRPSLEFYTYGPHNLTNQFGYHYVFNNQTDNADVWLCKGYDGWGGFTEGEYGDGVLDANLTPVNSIQLTPTRNDYMYSGCQGGAAEKHI